MKSVNPSRPQRSIARRVTTQGDTNAKIFLALLKTYKVPAPVAEFAFAARATPPRKWRFDFCWVGAGVALEIEGAVWTNGRHTRGSGFMKDMEKYNAAALLGYRVFRVASHRLCTLDTVMLIQKALETA